MIALATSVDWRAAVLSGAVASVALVVLVRSARALGLADDGSDAPERKGQRAAVPLAGGPALVLALAALALWPEFLGTRHVLAESAEERWSFAFGALALAVALAFATGLADDLRRAGLAPVPKLAGQCAAGVALAAGLQAAGAEPTLLERALVVVAAVAAQNVANTFDHADGTLGSAAWAAYAGAGSGFAGALTAFLGFNLGRARPGGPPLAYLGDSGSHVLGLLLATTSLGQAALTLPAVDLARVVALRLCAGEPAWRGDRRHLGQRLQAAGRGPVAVVALALLCAAPAYVALAFGRGPGAQASGALGCAVLLSIVLRLHPAPAAGSDTR